MPTQTRKIFLSSTFIDLKEYREAAVAACRRVGLQPVYMESFPPDPRDAVAFCKAKVEEADLFIGLYAHRYGYVPDGSKVSITEMEYDWACERGLPPFLFVVDSDYPWPPTKVDKGRDLKRLERFKDRIGKQHVLKKFRNPQAFKEDVLILGTELAQARPEASPSAASPASPTAPVLPAPKLVSPTAGTVFSVYPRATTLVWSEVPGAVSYVVEWDYKGVDAWASEQRGTSGVMIRSATTTAPFNFIGAQPGRWRVWAVSANGMEGAKSEWREFSYTK